MDSFRGFALVCLNSFECFNLIFQQDFIQRESKVYILYFWIPPRPQALCLCLTSSQYITFFFSLFPLLSPLSSPPWDNGHYTKSFFLLFFFSHYV